MKVANLLCNGIPTPKMENQNIKYHVKDIDVPLLHSAKKTVLQEGEDIAHQSAQAISDEFHKRKKPAQQLCKDSGFFIKKTSIVTPDGTKTLKGTMGIHFQEVSNKRRRIQSGMKENSHGEHRVVTNTSRKSNVFPKQRSERSQLTSQAHSLTKSTNTNQGLRNLEEDCVMVSESRPASKPNHRIVRAVRKSDSKTRGHHVESKGTVQIHGDSMNMKKLRSEASSEKKLMESINGKSAFERLEFGVSAACMQSIDCGVDEFLESMKNSAALNGPICGKMSPMLAVGIKEQESFGKKIEKLKKATNKNIPSIDLERTIHTKLDEIGTDMKNIFNTRMSILRHDVQEQLRVTLHEAKEEARWIVMKELKDNMNGIVEEILQKSKFSQLINYGHQKLHYDGNGMVRKLVPRD